MNHSAGRASPLDVAARLWPGPDPVNYAKRQAIAHLVKLDRALKTATELRASADELIFPEISKLWIHPTRLEILLSLLQVELEAAARQVAGAVDVLHAARRENDIRNCEERLLEREQKAAASRG